MTLVARFGYTSTDVRQAACTVAEAIGDFVCISAPPVSGKDQVSKADPADYDTLPAVGVIISKPTTITCVVQWFGETPAIFTGLSAGETYFLGTDSKASAYPPIPTTEDVFIQTVGLAVSDTKMYIKPEGNLTLRKVG
jgi:hypothetical protein